MVIAVNTRILSGESTAVKFLIAYFEKAAAANRQHQFYFISSNEEVTYSANSNIQQVVIKQQTANPLLWKLWYNYKLPAALKKIKADVLVSFDAVACLRLQLPQVLLVNDMAFVDHPEWYTRRYVRFLKSSMPVAFQKAAVVFTSAEAVRTALVKQVPQCADKVYTCAYGHTKQRSVSGEEKAAVKAKFTAGNEFFLFRGAIHNRSKLTNLLKAFSVFKKRQKSSMQLVLLVDTIPAKDPFVDSLRLYKYRNEVQLLTGLGAADENLLLASAWCMINLSQLYSDILLLQQSLQQEVPVIAQQSELTRELLKEAALYAEGGTVDSIAAQLMLIYKDEAKYTALVKEGQRITAATGDRDCWQKLQLLIQ